MRHIPLGKTGLMVSPLCIGTWQLAGPLSFEGKPDGHPDPGKANILRLIARLSEQGINFIDTAEQYGNGEAERRVGESIGGQRDKWIVSTKFGFRVAPDGGREDDCSPPTIMRSLEGSLERLQTDYIDIYLYHMAPDPDELDRAREILESARSDGKIRFYGISTDNVRLVEIMAQKQMADVVQYSHSLLHPHHAMRELATKQRIGTQVRGVMAGGRLSGKYLHGTPQWQSDDRRSAESNESGYRQIAPLNDLLPEGYTLAQAAIRWVIDQDGCDSICMGAKSIEDYQTAINALSLPPLSPEFKRDIERKAAEIMNG